MRSINANEYILTNGHVDMITLRDDLHDYFNTLHYMLSDTEFDHISNFAKSWIESHLSDQDRLIASVRSKAHEISSGDHLADYYQALLQRRDQLLAARDVFREYTSYLRDIFSEDRNIVMNVLKSFDFDHGIYLRALEYQKAREAAVQLYNQSLDQELADIEKSIAFEDARLEKADTNEKSSSVSGKSTAKSKSSVPKKRLFRKSL